MSNRTPHQGVSPERCNVTWETPSDGSTGSMPIGNGDIGLNLWVEGDGDLLFYLSKTDSWDEHCALLKLGRIRVKLSPNPFAKGHPFRQELRLLESEIKILAGAGASAVTLRIWVDANAPVVRVEAESEQPLTMRASLEVWRTQPRELRAGGGVEGTWMDAMDKDSLPVAYPDAIVQGETGRVIWYHRNQKSLWSATLKHQGLESLIPHGQDPLMNRTFGGLMKGMGMANQDARTLESLRPTTHFLLSIHALTAQTPTADAWVNRVGRYAHETDAQRLDAARRKHRAWWKKFWNRSWISVEEPGVNGTAGTAGTAGAAGSAASDGSAAAVVTRGYALQRFINACAGRGRSPIKFNGSIFTSDVPGKFDADYRPWGGGYWFQNTRLAYWSMISPGDFDLMRTWFQMYKDAIPLALKRTRIYYGHEGAFFPETMYFWGTYLNGGLGYGWERKDMPPGLTENTYIRYYWSGGLELATIMMDYFAVTRDTRFVREILIPIAGPVITFFDKHWNRDDNGRIHFDPAGSLETWHVATNPLPEVAGLTWVLQRLLSEMPRSLVTPEQRRQWKRILDELPAVPMREESQHRFLLPAEKFSALSNCENPELYAVFPYRLYGAGKPDLEVGIETWKRRVNKGTGGWQQTGIQAAYLGLADEAMQSVVTSFSTKHADSRFPAFWGPNYDWIPDQDHGCVAMIALQRMLMQCEGRRILLLPAWPADWDVSFKLHAPYRTVVGGVIKNGKLQTLRVTPKARRQDVEVMGPQVASVR